MSQIPGFGKWPSNWASGTRPGLDANLAQRMLRRFRRNLDFMMMQVRCDNLRVPTAQQLLTAQAVRERAHMVLAAALSGRLNYFTVNEGRLATAADYVVETIRLNFPSLDVPFHSRWRHFVVDGMDRWQAMAALINGDYEARARTRFDLAVTSVLLDAGTGPEWRWRDPQTGVMLARSEGLAIASLEAFKSGLFSSDPNNPLRVDADGLKALTVERLGKAFQVAEDNVLAGLKGRTLLLNRLGAVVAADTLNFGPERRVAGLFDVLKASTATNSIQAAAILAAVLAALGPIWPGRITLDGLNLGDTWQHASITIPGPTCGLIPFHKLSQWLSYSLIEPLQETGLKVTGIDELTGLAEYRNGGLMLDLGILEPTSRDLFDRAFTPADPPIIEWRALTVALIDRIAPLVRQRLRLNATELPLASILEGGTWRAGRRIAGARRADGAPPVRIISDGSVF
jgi:hypothetical protein